MQFANADMFWLFLSAVFVYTVGRWALRAQEKQLAAFADAQLASRLLAGFESVVARKRQTVLLASLATLCFAAVLLRPQWGFTWKEASRRGLDIMIALDTSSSMLAEDVKPNRLVRAQREVADLLRHLRGDRIGLVLFAGTSFLEVPLTLDYGLFRLFLSSVSTEAIPVPGTNVEDAIIEGVRGLDRGSRPDTAIFSRPKRDRALILITDGEDFEGNMDRAARTAKDA
ncbi:MAG TPA: VWA domain-containing protein, partial [Oligoflexia bacterium]|nr:VWA domain-containing protein [Oligoflexia bacterium]